MDVDLIIRLAGVGLVVAILGQVLSKTGRDEQATWVAIGGIIIIATILVGKMGELLEAMRGVFGI